LPTLALLVEPERRAIVNVSVGQRSRRRPRGGDTGREGVPYQFRKPAKKIMARGSGFIIGPAGEVVTNNRVIANADKVTIISEANSRHTPQVVGRDEKTGHRPPQDRFTSKASLGD
jgi:S1-C subfamily serine protease